MELNLVSQLKAKTSGWTDIVFYFVVSLLVATILCWGVFAIKITLQKQQLAKAEENIQSVGTENQKTAEKEVLKYQKKIQDFTVIFKNHEFTSKIFDFFQKATMPDIWYNSFQIDKKNNEVSLSGEAESMDSYSRQVSLFEKNPYIKKLGQINSRFADAGRVSFSVSLTFNESLFTPVSDLLKKEAEKPATSGRSVELLNPTEQETTQTEE